ncbi:hypothetical protein HKX48_004404 [Thoreauomyces humboldtii]|nr:hypothetical protein HKX48_004404 [Thoreauomyces humboldtii]
MKLRQVDGILLSHVRSRCSRVSVPLSASNVHGRGLTTESLATVAPTSPTPTKPLSPRSPRPVDPHTGLKVYVLPTLNGKYAFHAAFLKPRTQFERGAVISAFILRKWRFQLSDTFAFAWHAFGARFTRSGGVGIGAFVYKWGNRVTTRKAADEYFLKSIPRITEHSLVDSSTDGDRHRSKLFLWALLLPSALYISKFYIALANILFTYNVFRLNASWRSMYGSKILQRLLDSRQVTWTASEALDEQVRALSADVTRRAEAEAGHGGKVWRWTKDSDLHDEVVDRLEADLKLAELARTYRRARMQYFVHGTKEH